MSWYYVLFIEMIAVIDIVWMKHFPSILSNDGYKVNEACYKAKCYFYDLFQGHKILHNACQCHDVTVTKTRCHIDHFTE